MFYLFGGSQKGGFQKGGFGRCSCGDGGTKAETRVQQPVFLDPQNRNEGTKNGTAVQQTRTRAHSLQNHPLVSARPFKAISLKTSKILGARLRTPPRGPRVQKNIASVTRPKYPSPIARQPWPSNPCFFGGGGEEKSSRNRSNPRKRKSCTEKQGKSENKGSKEIEKKKKGLEGQGWEIANGGQNVLCDFFGGGGKCTIECALQNQFWDWSGLCQFPLLRKMTLGGGIIGGEVQNRFEEGFMVCFPLPWTFQPEVGFSERMALWAVCGFLRFSAKFFVSLRTSAVFNGSCPLQIHALNNKGGAKPKPHRIGCFCMLWAKTTKKDSGLLLPILSSFCLRNTIFKSELPFMILNPPEQTADKQVFLQENAIS